MVRENKDYAYRWVMDYTKHIRGISGVNSARLALWVALLFVVVVAGVAILGSGLS
jgi:hypothetical protein